MKILREQFHKFFFCFFSCTILATLPFINLRLQGSSTLGALPGGDRNGSENIFDSFQNSRCVCTGIRGFANGVCGKANTFLVSFFLLHGFFVLLSPSSHREAWSYEQGNAAIISESKSESYQLGCLAVIQVNLPCVGKILDLE